MFKTLDQVRSEVAARLTDAAGHRQSPMHVPVVVTSDVDARIMVLRDFDADTWTLRFHTDVRAPKVAAIESDPRMAVLFYDKKEKVQIRARGTGRILRDGPIADRAWAGSHNFARRCYLGDGPGTESDSPTSGLPTQFEGVEPTDEEVVPARVNFGLVVVTISEFDWFYLAHSGHSRALFRRDDNGDGDADADGGDDGDGRDNGWRGQWISP